MKAFDSRAPSNSDVAPTKPTFLSFPRLSPRVAARYTAHMHNLSKLRYRVPGRRWRRESLLPKHRLVCPYRFPSKVAAASTTNTGATAPYRSSRPPNPLSASASFGQVGPLPLAAIDINYGGCKRCKCRNLDRIAGAHNDARGWRNDARGWLATVSRLRALPDSGLSEEDSRIIVSHLASQVAPKGFSGCGEPGD
jgi:hypothetical protein